MNEHGGIIINGQQVASTLMCPHCGTHFVSIRGSGKRRTFCLRCKAVTCGAVTCDPCIPLEARLERQEGKKSNYDKLINELVGEGGVLL